MKRFGPFLCLVLIIVILMTLTSCAPVAALPAVTTPSVNASVTVTLSENARVKGAAWVADDILAYYAEDGVHIWNAESGDGANFVVSDTFDIDKGVDFALSPDRSKVCVLIDDVRGNDRCGVYEVHTGKLLLNVDLPNDFAQKHEIYRLQYDTGFLDDNTLYLSNKFEIWLVDINKGDQQRITADASDFYESSDKTGRDYFEWVYAPVMVDGKLYYSGIRNDQWQSRIYCADLNGETEIDIDGNVGMGAAVLNRGFLYEIENNDDRQTWFYNIKTGTSDFVFGDNLSAPVISGKEIGYIQKGVQDNDFIAMLYNIDTKQTQSFPIYQAARDFPQENYHQFNGLCGFTPDGDGYVFIFLLGHRNKTEFVLKTLCYQTRTGQVVEAADYNGYDLYEDGVSPSGEYMLLIGKGDETGNGYPIKVIKTADYIHPETGA